MIAWTIGCLMFALSGGLADIHNPVGRKVAEQQTEASDGPSDDALLRQEVDRLEFKEAEDRRERRLKEATDPFWRELTGRNPARNEAAQGARHPEGWKGR